MGNVKTLSRNVNLLNMLLLGVAFFFAQYLAVPMLDFNIKYILPAGERPKHEDERPAGINERVPSISDYLTVADNSLFHPERRIPAEKKAVEQQQPLAQPEIVLYGTLITDDVKLAYLEDLKTPRNTPGRGRRQTTMKIGDNLGGFVLKQIDTDKIVLMRGEEKMMVSVRDTERKKTRETHAAVSSSTPVQTAPKSQQQPASPTSRKAIMARQREALKPERPPQSRPAEIMPPRDAFEQTVVDFFDRKKD
jgi:hypothetical protein